MHSYKKHKLEARYNIIRSPWTKRSREKESLCITGSLLTTDKSASDNFFAKGFMKKTCRSIDQRAMGAVARRWACAQSEERRRTVPRSVLSYSQLSPHLISIPDSERGGIHARLLINSSLHIFIDYSVCRFLSCIVCSTLRYKKNPKTVAAHFSFPLKIMCLIWYCVPSCLIIHRLS